MPSWLNNALCWVYTNGDMRKLPFIEIVYTNAKFLGTYPLKASPFALPAFLSMFFLLPA